MRTRSQRNTNTSIRLRTRSQGVRKSGQLDDVGDAIISNGVPSSLQGSMRTRSRDTSVAIDAAKLSGQVRKRDAAEKNDNARDPPRRQPVRKAVLDKQPEPTAMFRHHLLLEPTLAREAKKRRQRERERLLARTNDPSRFHTTEDEGTNPETKTGQVPSKYDSKNFILQEFQPEIKGLRKRSSAMADLKEEVSSIIASATKAPMRKMSAMTPVHERSLRVATFRRSQEEVLPEGAVELMAQADMARRKKKKKTICKKSLNSHSSHTSTGVGSPWVTPPRKSPYDCELEMEVKGSNSAQVLDRLPEVHRSTTVRNENCFRMESTRNGSAAAIAFPSMRNLSAYSERAINVMLRRRLFVVDFLLSANDISSIYAGIVVVNDLYQGEDFPPYLARLVLNTEAMGIILLTQRLMEDFAKPRILGGLSSSGLGARLLVKRMIDRLTLSLMGDMVLMPEQMLGVGLAFPESLEVLSMLRKIVDEVRQVFLLLSEKVLALGADYSVLVPISVAPQFVVDKRRKSNTFH